MGTLKKLNPALGIPGFRAFVVAMMLTLLGSVAQSAGIAWDLNKSPETLGIVLLAQGLPLTLVMLGGKLAERFDRFKLAILGELLGALQAGLLLLLWAEGWLSLPVLLSLSVFLGLVNALTSASVSALALELVGEEDIQSSVAANAAAGNLSVVFGSLAGGMAASLGVGTCFAINLVSYVPAVICFYSLRNKRMRQQRPARQRATSYREVLRHVVSGRKGSMLVLTGVIGFAGSWYTTLLAPLTKLVLHSGSVSFGILSAVGSVGVVAGSLAAGYVKKRLAVTAGATALGLAGAVAAAAVLLVFPLTMAILAIAGGCWGFTMASLRAVILDKAPHEYYGRLQALCLLSFYAPLAVGRLMAGLLAQAIGIPDALLVSSAILGACAIGYLVRLARNTRPAGQTANPDD